MALEKYLKDLDKAERTRMVLTLMQYPRSKTLLERDEPVLTAYYSCEASKCSFKEAETAIKEQVDLRAFGATDVALTLLKEISENPDDFLPHKFDGYQLYRGGFDLLRLQRKEGKVAASSGRMGFIEYNDMRAKAKEETSRARKEALEVATVRVVDSIHSAKRTCTIM